MVALSYHGTVNVLQGTIAPDAGPFGQYEWFALLEDAGMRPLVVVAQDGQKTAAMVLAQGHSGLEAMGNWYNFTWQPISNSPLPDANLLRAIAHDLKTRTHHIMLAPLADEDGTASAMEHAFRASGWHVRRVQCDHNLVLPVKGRSFAQYQNTLPGPLRTVLKRKSSKVKVRIITQFDADIWQTYASIYEKSWKPQEGAPDLLRRFAETQGHGGKLRMAIAMRDGIAVAAQFWTVENKVAYIHKLAHLPEFRSLSAGSILTAALLEYVIDTDAVELVDFGTGNDAYKADWMELVRPRYRLECSDPHQIKAWPRLLRQFASRVARPFGRS